jgi:zinc transport system substrate-binding protein
MVTMSQALSEFTTAGVTPGTNAHLWLDPRLACVGVSNIAAALQRIDAAGASVYRSNALAYIARLQKLDAEIEAGLAGLTNRAIVTYHDAFPYFAKRYNLEVVGVVEEVPDVNPGPRTLARLTETIRTRGIRVLYIESGSHSSIARRIAKDLKLTIAELDTIEAGELKLDAYEKRMRANMEVLRRTLR